MIISVVQRTLHVTYCITLSDLNVTINKIWQLYKIYKQVNFLCVTEPRDNDALTLGNGIPIVSFIENQSGAVIYQDDLTCYTLCVCYLYAINRNELSTLLYM